MFSIKSVDSTVPHESHNTKDQLCVLTSMNCMVHAANTALCQIQISDDNSSWHYTRVIHAHAKNINTITKSYTDYSLAALYI